MMLQPTLGTKQYTAEVRRGGFEGRIVSFEPPAAPFAADPNSAYVATKSVPMHRLDGLAPRWLTDDRAVWLKADVQGYEWPVLEGSAAVLGRSAAVEIELSLVPLYRGQPLLGESVARLGALGFHLAAVEEVFVDQRTGAAFQFAGIFLRDE